LFKGTSAFDSENSSVSGVLPQLRASRGKSNKRLPISNPTTLALITILAQTFTIKI